VKIDFFALFAAICNEIGIRFDAQSFYTRCYQCNTVFGKRTLEEVKAHPDVARFHTPYVRQQQAEIAASGVHVYEHVYYVM
jgi:uncharacterized protein with PIN domain